MYQLVEIHDRLQLEHLSDKSIRPIYVDFSTHQLTYRRQYGGTESIAKAVGIQSNIRPNILDLSAGFGRDAFILASKGCQVTLLERVPMIAQLLADGLKRGKETATIKNIIECMHLIEIDAITYLEQNKDILLPSVFYFDPMFPKRLKSAKVKKEMLALQSIAGSDEDADIVFLKAKDLAKRLVVKRPNHSTYLCDLKPSHSIKSKNHRFDVYLNLSKE